MSAALLPPPEAVENILVWHQGALGDLLLAGPALTAVSSRYPQARLTGVGHPERWGLLHHTLPLAAVWDSAAAFWAPLFMDSPLPPALAARLAPFELALVFSPRPPYGLLARCRQAGIPEVHWVPSFPKSGGEAVAALHARHLAGLGLGYQPAPLRLVPAQNPGPHQVPELPGPGPWVALGPGRGHPVKNWPLAHYYEVSRALAWRYRMRVVWLAGPAEAAWLPYLEPLTRALGHQLLSHLPLTRLAAVLSRCRLYLGGDSGLTHLAAAAGARAVLALFGPTAPRVWSPLGERVRVLTGPCPAAPCTPGREMACPKAQCLADLAPETVLGEAAALLAEN